MNLLEATGVICAGSMLAGLLGSLSGLGGGIVVIPLLTLGFGVDIRLAMGASLVSAIASSSGSAATYLRAGFVNLRVAMFLETATVLGAIAGAVLAGLFPTGVLGLLFGLFLILNAWLSRGAAAAPAATPPADGLAQSLALDGALPGPGGPEAYKVHRPKTGFLLMLGAGVASGLLGIGSGVFKVLAMDRVMGIPIRASTTTSSFMIGVTAAAGAGVFLARGFIVPAIAMPVMVGVLCGALLGARLMPHVRSQVLRLGFAALVGLLGMNMVLRAVLNLFQGGV